MPTTIPQFQSAIDTLFTQTWQEMRPDATDQILNATPVWALLKAKGIFDTQTGGSRIERTVRYAIGTRTPVKKGVTLPMGEVETHTAAYWPFRNVVSHAQRDLFSDRENQGKYKIRSYVKDRLDAAQDALKQGYEDDVMRAANTNEDGDYIQSINDITVPVGLKATGTYGGLARSNDWWQAKYQQYTGPQSTNMVSDMKKHWNTVSDNRENPDVLLTDKDSYEIYEDFGLDAVQVLGNQKMLDLGFDVLKFKGADLTWSPKVTAGNVHFLNTKYIEAIFDPTLWFDMSEWKQIPNQTERVAHIFCCMNLICRSLRNQGLLYL